MRQIRREYSIGDRVVLVADQATLRGEVAKSGTVGTIAGPPEGRPGYWADGSLPVWAVRLESGDLFACNGFDIARVAA